jgi:hypothetical protein
MYGCEVMWGDEKAVAIRALVEESIGGPCPCRRGLACPVLPKDLVLPDPVPRESVA